MKLSTRARYGTRALIEISRNFGVRPTKRREIAKAQKLTPGYLENILSVLKNRGLVRPTRGADGGFLLTRAPAEITLLDIVLALEGSIAPVECVEDTVSCDRSSRCGARKAWKRLHDAQNKVLSSMTLADLAAMEDGAGSSDFSI